jgi:hypothetical protein
MSQEVDPKPELHSVKAIPLWVKVAYTLFMCILVPYYWLTYGPTNFLYFCDVALFLTLAALWLENPLLAAMPAVGIVLPQTLWAADFLGGLAGYRLTGMTEYMFKPSISLAARGLSLFHGWLPFFLLWVVYRLGYHRWAFAAWVALAWGLMLVSYFFMAAPPAPPDNPNLPVNINYVYGLSDDHAQTWMAPELYLTLLMAAFPLVLFLPTHLLLRRFYPQCERRSMLRNSPLGLS